MKEFDIRLWDEKAKEMIFVDDLYYFEENHIHQIKDGFADGIRKCKSMFWTTAMDSNNQKIYDGDLIVAKDYPFYGDALEDKYEELNYIGEVYWCEESLMWRVYLHGISKQCQGTATAKNLCELLYHSLACTVIGNIHQNKDLLQVDKGEDYETI